MRYDHERDQANDVDEVFEFGIDEEKLKEFYNHMAAQSAKLLATYMHDLQPYQLHAIFAASLTNLAIVEEKTPCEVLAATRESLLAGEELWEEAKAILLAEQQRYRAEKMGI